MNKLLGIGGVLVVLGGFVMLVMPVGHIPLLDANRAVLAESEREGLCAGEVFANTRGYGNEQQMTECVTESVVNNDINWRLVQPAFCRGVIDGGIQITQTDCEEIMSEREFWPTMTGSLTESWNKRFPYPGDFLSADVPSNGGESRTGDRESNEREGNTR